jgi:hypothetical protein
LNRSAEATDVTLAQRCTLLSELRQLIAGRVRTEAWDIIVKKSVKRVLSTTTSKIFLIAIPLAILGFELAKSLSHSVVLLYLAVEL